MFAAHGGMREGVPARARRSPRSLSPSLADPRQGGRPPD